MNAQQQEHRPDPHHSYGFGIGLLTGACVGAGLAFLFAPRLAALYERATASAKDLGERVADGYEQVSARVEKVTADVTRKGQDVRDGLADVVANGAHEVERYAKAAKVR